MLRRVVGLGIAPVIPARRGGAPEAAQGPRAKIYKSAQLCFWSTPVVRAANMTLKMSQFPGVLYYEMGILKKISLDQIFFSKNLANENINLYACLELEDGKKYEFYKNRFAKMIRRGASQRLYRYRYSTATVLI